MKRRSFLSMLGAAGVAPLVPGSALGAGAVPSAATAVTGYNRYMYGLAVFQARTRASVCAADLVARLKVTAAQADAMMGEMTAKGIVSPIAQSAIGAARARIPNSQIKPSDTENSLRRLADWVTKDDDSLTSTQLDALEQDPSARPERSVSEQET